MNVELANALVPPEIAMLFWNTKSSPLKQSKIHIDLAFCHVFISYSLRPCSHHTTVTYEVGIDLSTEEINEPLVDIRINQWYSLYPSRGLRRPKGPERAWTEAAGSESEAEGS
ncbi:hypothetical protein LWI28_006145 [Acer negundo]|uniref:Uncharacterized protein n=1 Tax=Acer negundo TaxID=4023 RepID=A0AAD5JFA7_ACENE|nr:hypothetical protein LWI28_006145 [Acer negundo]